MPEPGETKMAATRRSVLGAALALPALRGASAQEAMTYLFPAPPFLPAFAPHQLAMRRGYYAAEGLNVTFQTGQGGANVATQVGAGNATLGGGAGETAMLVRANGVPVRGVALLGGRSLFHIAVRKAANVRGIAGLRGKRVGVIGFQDTGFYALLGVLAAHGMRRTDLQLQAVGAAGVTQLMIAGSLDAIMSVPEWTDAMREAGVELELHDINAIFPAMSQAIMTSDATLQRRPAVVRGFVRAVLRGVRDCMADPAAAARDYVAQVPQHAGKEASIERILRHYATEVYPTDPAAALGRFDPVRLAATQRFYLDNEIIRTAVPVADLYTNDAVG
jgi:NitT/TauT family transport system substrate-binding protein